MRLRQYIFVLRIALIIIDQEKGSAPRLPMRQLLSLAAPEEAVPGNRFKYIYLLFYFIIIFHKYKVFFENASIEAILTKNYIASGTASRYNASRNLTLGNRRLMMILPGRWSCPKNLPTGGGSQSTG
jgi:hypothetical protein